MLQTSQSSFSRTSLSETIIISDIWLYEGHILLRNNPCFHKLKTSCYICKYLVFSQQKYYKSTHNFFFFLIFHVFCSKYLPWVIEFQEKSVNHTNLDNKTLYRNTKFINLANIFDTEGTFGKGG